MNKLLSNLQLAHAQAQLNRGFCAPNPAVGAVIVKDERIIAQGSHRGAGWPHAEIDALQLAGNEARGATLYVTLEPCNHHGRTPPCTEAIISAGITKLYYGFADPNPAVQGKGAEYLNAQGVKTEYLHLAEIDAFYRSYVYWLQYKRPFLTAKLALSADNKIAGEKGEPLVITGPEALLVTHQKRRQTDAILTSVRTIINDDPKLNVRLDTEVVAKPLYIVDRLAHLPLSAKIFQTARNITIFHAENASLENLKQLQAQGVRCVVVPISAGMLQETTILELIGDDGIHDLWLEAGAALFESFYSAGLMQRAYLYVSRHSLGSSALAAERSVAAYQANAVSVQESSLGQDQLYVLNF